MTDGNIDQQFVEYVVKSLVGHPDDVVVERTIDEKGVLLKLTVNPEDLGRVIGKRGVTAQSIRTLLRALGTKNDARYNFKIMDDGEKPERRADRDEDVKPQSTDAPDEDSKADDTAQDEPADEPTEEPVEEPEQPEKQEPEEEEQSLADKTREELAEFDDLDI